jgi:hypothetical protein
MTDRHARCARLRLRVPVPSAVLGAWTIHVPVAVKADTGAERSGRPPLFGALSRSDAASADLSSF